MDIQAIKPEKKLVSIAVVPAYNESRFISNVILSVKNYVDKVIVIDDGSTDDTLEIARKCGVIVYRNEKNVGKWFSLKRGFSKMRPRARFGRGVYASETRKTARKEVVKAETIIKLRESKYLKKNMVDLRKPTPKKLKKIR